MKFNKGLIRHLHIIIDYSLYIEHKTYIPNMKITLLNGLKKFIDNFYKENPISFLTVAINRNKKSSNYTYLMKAADINFLYRIEGEGQFSLAESLEYFLTCSSNQYLKEVLVLSNSVGTFDDTVKIYNQYIKKNIQINIINFSAEVFFYRQLTEKTFGQFFLPIDFQEYEKALIKLVKEKNLQFNTRVKLLQVGFPSVDYSTTFCSCHGKIKRSGFHCPSCNTRICNLPIKCKICDLQIISNKTFAKSLFTYRDGVELIITAGKCSICKSNSEKKCLKCNMKYCIDCMEFLKNKLKICIFCE